jgi:hypothetical protein
MKKFNAIEFRLWLSRVLILAGVLWTFAFLATACGIDDVFTAVTAAMAAIGPVLTLVGSLLAPGEAALITTAVGDLSNVIVALKTAVDTYLADTSDTTLLEKVEEALTVAQNAVPSFLAALNISNATIKAWVTAVISAVNGVIVAVASDILKPAKAELAAKGSIGEELKATLEARSKDILTAFVGQVDAATASSGLPETAKSKFHGEFHRHVGHHIGPVPY